MSLDEIKVSTEGHADNEAESSKVDSQIADDVGKSDVPISEIIEADSIKWEIMREVVERLGQSETRVDMIYALCSIAYDIANHETVHPCIKGWIEDVVEYTSR